MRSDSRHIVCDKHETPAVLIIFDRSPGALENLFVVKTDDDSVRGKGEAPRVTRDGARSSPAARGATFPLTLLIKRRFSSGKTSPRRDCPSPAGLTASERQTSERTTGDPPGEEQGTSIRGGVGRTNAAQWHQLQMARNQDGMEAVARDWRPFRRCPTVSTVQKRG